MTIETLGGLIKAVERKFGTGTAVPSTLQARAEIYRAMGDYIYRATDFTHGYDSHPRPISEAMGELIYTLAVDAKVNLAPEKFDLLEGYPLTEDQDGLELNKELLHDGLIHTWGGEDIFIERLSGGLFGSYLKALSALKPQARALGHDLSTATEIYVKTL